MSILVTGSFDSLHSGHIAFLKTASHYGDLCVGIGSDRSIASLKGRVTVNKQDERLFMVRAVRYVHIAWINSGMGNIDFEDDLLKHNVWIDTLIVNEDQDFPEKRELCEKYNIKYIVLKRVPEPGLPVRSSTALRNGR